MGFFGSLQAVQRTISALVLALASIIEHGEHPSLSSPRLAAIHVPLDFVTSDGYDNQKPNHREDCYLRGPSLYSLSSLSWVGHHGGAAFSVE